MARAVYWYTFTGALLTASGATTSALAQCKFAGGVYDYQVSHGFDVGPDRPRQVFGLATGTWKHSILERTRGPDCESAKADLQLQSRLLLGVGEKTETSLPDLDRDSVQAEADSRWIIERNDARQVLGTLCSFGKARIVRVRPPRAVQVRSSSKTGLYVEIGNIVAGHVVRTGHMRGGPTVFGTRTRMIDPIGFVVTDASAGTILSQGTLLSVEATLLAGSPGGLCINDEYTCPGQSVFDAAALDFSIQMSSSAIPNPAERGDVKLEIREGRVTTADSSGVFAGILPSVGATTPVVLASILDFAFDPDLGTFAQPVSARLDFGGGGEAEAEQNAPGFP